MMPHQFETEMAQGLQTIYADIMYKAARISGVLKMYLAESVSGAQWDTALCVATLFYLLECSRENIFVKHSVVLSFSSAAAAGTVPSTSVDPSSKEGPQQPDSSVRFTVLFKNLVSIPLTS